MSLPIQQPAHTRKMRIYKHYFPRAWSNYVVFPEIRLAGRWLMESGFVPGQRIRVTCEYERIVITPDENETVELKGRPVPERSCRQAATFLAGYPQLSSVLPLMKV